MNRRISIILGLAAVIILAVVAFQPAFAGHQWILLHHKDQGRGQPTFEQCMPIESWAGHADHVGDWYQGPYDNNECLPPTATPVPTDAPTATPTDAPQPTPTPTEIVCLEECQPTPTPTDEPGCEVDCEPTPAPTNPPPTEPLVTPELPEAGFVSQGEIMNGEPWQLSVPGNVWAGHNQSDWPAGQWWLLWEGREFLFNGQWYTTIEYIIADPTEVELIGQAVNYDLMLITCRGYSAATNTWSERLVIFANLSE